MRRCRRSQFESRSCTRTYTRLQAFFANYTSSDDLVLLCRPGRLDATNKQLAACVTHKPREIRNEMHAMVVADGGRKARINYTIPLIRRGTKLALKTPA